MALLDSAAQQRVETVIAEVERGSSCEIVVASLDASDSYADLRLLYGLGVGLIAAAVTHLIWPLLSFGSLLSLQAAAIALVFVLLGAGPLFRALMPSARITASVERRAREAFVERALYSTRDRTGVLILISELEHRVVIMGDSGIDAFVHAEGWQKYVDRLVSAIRQGRAADELCALIGEIGVVLAAHLPAKADDTDELSNRVLTQV